MTTMANQDNMTTINPLDRIAKTKMLTAVHSIAFVSGFISLIFSMVTLICFFYFNYGKPFYKRKQGERLVVYLAISDLLFGTEHMLSHLLNMVFGGIPPTTLCIISGFLLQMFVWTQAIIVIICALSAFLLVTKGIRLSFGRYDYRLLLPTLLIPSILAIAFASLNYLGSSGYWCHADITKKEAKIVYDINGVLMISVLIICIVLYSGVVIKMSKVSKLLRTTRGRDDPKNPITGRQRTAKILVCFVIAYFAQWWPLVVYPIWAFIETPHVVMIILIVLFCNLGGMFNFFAYTHIRRIIQTKSPSESSSLRNFNRANSLSNRGRVTSSENGTMLVRVHTQAQETQVQEDTCP